MNELIDALRRNTPLDALPPLTGKVAKIMDCYTVAINRGASAGVRLGEILVIGDDIIDPETGECIGTSDRLRVKVTEVHPRFCIAETYRLEPLPPMSELLAASNPMRAVEAAFERRPIEVNIGDDVRRLSRVPAR